MKQYKKFFVRLLLISLSFSILWNWLVHAATSSSKVTIEGATITNTNLAWSTTSWNWWGWTTNVNYSYQWALGTVTSWFISTWKAYRTWDMNNDW